MRTILAIWATICFITPLYSLMQYPLLKLTTPMAIRNIEEKIIKPGELTAENKKIYTFNKEWILGNYVGLKQSADTRQSLLSLIGIISGILALYLAVKWPHLTSKSRRDAQNKRAPY